MAKGTYGGGQIELHVLAEDLDLNDAAHKAVVDQWKKSFEVASCMLYHATGKKAHFARIYLHGGDSEAWDPDSFDARISNSLVSSYALGHPTVAPEDPPSWFAQIINAIFGDAYESGDAVGDPQAFREGTFMALGVDAFEHPFVVLHEFGHFGYGLGDEYIGEKPTLCTKEQRVGPAARGHVPTDGEHSCIMGANLGSHNVTTIVPQSAAPPAPPYWVRHGWIVEFCNDDNHVDDNGSNHNSMHNDKSCASVIKERFADLDVPKGVAVPKANGEMAPCPGVQWPPTTSDTETNVVLDDTLEPGLSPELEDPTEWGVEAITYGESFARRTDRIFKFQFGRSAQRPGFLSVPRVGDALDSVRQNLSAVAKRPAARNVLLFSTGRESVPSARKVAKAITKEGGRVFTFGLGRDRAALQQLAQRTGGAYFEVTNPGQRSSAENTQLLRTEIARVYDNLRFGAPITYVPGEFSSSGNKTVKILVEDNSEQLKLVLARKPVGGKSLAVVPPPGSRQRMKHEVSSPGGFEWVIVEKPTKGLWEVKLPKGADLTAYSQNPRIQIGVTGWRKLRLARETVKLQVVIRAPFAVTGLDVAEVHITPPSGSGARTETLKPRRDGVHSASFRATESGAYDVVVRVKNDGRARLVNVGLSSQPMPSVPAFERTRRFQVHVAAWRGRNP